MSERRRSQSCEEKRRTRPLEIENRIFTIMPRICHWHGQCVALSLSLLSQRRWSLFAAVFVNAHVVWHSVVLHGNVLGTILEHWLPHHVSHCTIVQRSPTLWSIYRIVFFSSISIFHVFAGAGYAIIIVNVICTIYYNTIIAYPIVFIVKSMASTLPWMHCGNEWNTPYCLEITHSVNNTAGRNLSELALGRSLYKTPADEFFQ